MKPLATIQNTLSFNKFLIKRIVNIEISTFKLKKIIR